MLTRFASISLSLLAHATIIYSAGNAFLPDETPKALANQGLKIAVVRAEPRAATTEPEVAAKTAEPKTARPTNPVDTPDKTAVRQVSQPKPDRKPEPARKIAGKKPAKTDIPSKPAPARELVETRQPEPEPVPPTTEPRKPVQVASLAPLPPSAASAEFSLSHRLLAEIEAEYLASLQLAIEQNKRYPRRALRRGKEGDVIVAFTVLSDGTITGISIATSSSNHSLDQAASGALAKLGRFQPIPGQLDRERWDFRIPIRFRLN